MVGPHERPQRSSLYSPHPSFATQRLSPVALRERTGKLLEQWVAIAQASGTKSQRECATWLKARHGLSLTYAQWIAERAYGVDPAADYQPEAMVEAMFGGAKAGLRPVYDVLLRNCLQLGTDVRACPCATIVPLYRRHVFAQLKPSTQTRLDLGLALKDRPITGRLVDTGGFAKGDRISRRIPISSIDEIDDEVRHWLVVAYEMDA
jgi:hypothetical protein